MHTLQEVYGIATIGDFSSVIRGAESQESDVDIRVSRQPGEGTMQNA